MSFTTMNRRLAILSRALERKSTDDVDYALTMVEIKIDSLHGERSATIDDLRVWFLENFDGDIEPHLAYIQTELEGLV